MSAGDVWRHKTPSTPHDSSEGILNGVNALSASAKVGPDQIAYFLHGTTVATNAVLEGKGARVGLVTTEGYRQVMQIARSFVPGGLAGWIVWPKPEPLARAGRHRRNQGAHGSRAGWKCAPLDEDDIRAALTVLKASGHRSADDQPDQRLSQRRARTRAWRRSRPKCCPTCRFR